MTDTPVPSYIVYTAGVTPESVQALLNTVGAAARRSDEVHLLMASPGGNINAGLYAYHMLRAMPTTLITSNVGSIASIAVIMYLAGECRYAARRSKFLTHGSAWTLSGAVQEQQLQQYLSAAKADNALMAGVISDRTGSKEEEAHALLAIEHVKDAHDAITLGIAHEIRDPQIPAGGVTTTIA